MTKGDAVTVVTGKAAGATGVVFWIGTTKFGKARVGVKTATGDLWVAPHEVAAQAPASAPTFAPKSDDARIAALEAQVHTLQLALSALAQVVDAQPLRQALAVVAEAQDSGLTFVPSVEAA